MECAPRVRGEQLAQVLEQAPALQNNQIATFFLEFTEMQLEYVLDQIQWRGKMKKHKLYAIVFVFMSAFALGIHAATIMIDPAIQESPPVGGTLIANVKVEDITGLFGYSFDLAFDNTALKFSAIEEGEFLKADGTFTFAFSKPDTPADVNLAGVLTFVNSRAGSGTTNIDGTGKLAAITFEVLEAKASALEFQNVMMANSDAKIIPIDIENGAIEVAASIKGDVNDDGEVRSNDAILTLRIAAGLMTPTDDQKWAADMNDDGRIRSNDAILILRKAVGLAAPSIGSAVASTDRQIAVMLTEAHGVAGGNITVPVEVNNTYGLAGGDVSISYDRTVLRAVDVSSDSDVLLASNLSESGMVYIAFANADRLSNGTVARIRFDILADDTSPLKLRTVELYGSDALPLNSRSMDTRFSSWAIPPEHSNLLQNFPNPLNPETWIPYQLRDASEVTIHIYNAAGELVRWLGLGYKPAGLYVTSDRAAHWDGKSKFGTPVASGVYFYSIRAGDFVAVRKLIVLK